MDKTITTQNAIILAAATIILVCVLYLGIQITGMQIADNTHFCESYDGFDFIPQNITLSQSTNHQLKLDCIPGNIKFQDNSDQIDISKDGVISLTGHPKHTQINAIIIAEHESGQYIAKKFRISII